MKSVRAILRAAHRLLTDENVDLWLLTLTAAVFTVLGIVDVASMNVLSAAILALLAALAFAQIKSRKLVAEIATDHSGSREVLLREFPEDLIRQRAEANDILLIGIALARTIQGGRDDFYRALTRGARLRVLLLDPTDEELVRQGALVRPRDAPPSCPSASRRRWMSSTSYEPAPAETLRSGWRSSYRPSA